MLVPAALFTTSTYISAAFSLGCGRERGGVDSYQSAEAGHRLTKKHPQHHLSHHFRPIPTSVPSGPPEDTGGLAGAVANQVGDGAVEAKGRVGEVLKHVQVVEAVWLADSPIVVCGGRVLMRGGGVLCTIKSHGRLH